MQAVDIYASRGRTGGGRAIGEDASMADHESPAPTLREVIADELRRLIVDGEFERGVWIRQPQLAKRFGVSLTPVREALRQLEAEGLLESVPQRGVRLATVDA